MNVEEEVCAAAMRLYEGIGEMETGQGIDKLKSAWEQGERVTAGHPSGEWYGLWKIIHHHADRAPAMAAAAEKFASAG